MSGECEVRVYKDSQILNDIDTW